MTPRISAGIADVGDHLRDPLFRNAYILIFSTGISSALGLVYWFLVARLYTPAAVGTNAAVISSLMFLAGLSMLNLRPVLGRFIPVAGRLTGRLVATCYLTCASIAVIAAVAYLATSRIWAGDGPLPALTADARLVAMFISGTALWTIFQLQDGVLIGLRAPGWMAVENIVFGVAKIALVVALALSTAGAYGITLSWLAPMLVAVAGVSLLVFATLVPRHVRGTPEPDDLVRPGTIARLAAGDYVGSLLALTYVALLPVIVINDVGPAAGGRFYIVWVIASSMQLIAPQMISSLLVETASDPSSFARQGRRMLVGMLRILVPIIAVTVVLATPILGVFGAEYETDDNLLRLLALAIVPYSLNTLFIALARIAIRPRQIIAVQGVLALLVVTLTLALIGPLGLTGVGVAFLAGQTIVAVGVVATGLRPVLLGRPAQAYRERTGSTPPGG